MRNCDKFDAELFFISANEANHMDPQQRLLLHLSYQSVKACAVSNLQKAAVFIGIQHMEYKNHIGLFLGNKSPFAATGSSFSVAAGRISYIFGCHGPSLSLDTACSSALVAISQCCDHVNSHDYASFAGSVNLMLSHETFAAIQLAGMLSDDGRCKTLDSTADGYGRSEAVSMSVIASDTAEIDKSASSIIKSAAINQDGRSSSLTAPNGPSQLAVILKCMGRAELHASSIKSVFLHGTGTPLGDPIEVGAILNLYNSISTYPSLIVPKSKFGHSEPASGAISVHMSRTSLSKDCENPVLHLRTLNKALEDFTSIKNGDLKSLNVPRQSRGAKIQKVSGESCHGVSSFAFQGTNSHLIMADSRAIDHNSEYFKSSIYFQKSFWPWGRAFGRISVEEEAMWVQVDLQHPEAMYLWDHTVRSVEILPASYLFDFCSQSMKSISQEIYLGSINNGLILSSTRLPKRKYGEILITACIRHNSLVICENISAHQTKIFAADLYCNHESSLMRALTGEGMPSRCRWLTKLGGIPLAAAVGEIRGHFSQGKKQIPASPAELDCISQITSAFRGKDLRLSIPISLEHGQNTNHEAQVARKWALGYLSTLSGITTFNCIYKGIECHSFESLMQFNGLLSKHVGKEMKGASMMEYSISPVVNKPFRQSDQDFLCGNKKDHFVIIINKASTRRYSINSNSSSVSSPLTYLQIVQNEKRQVMASFVSPCLDSFIPSRNRDDLSSFSIAKAAVEEEIWLKAQCIKLNSLSHPQIKYENFHQEPLEFYVETGFISSPEIFPEQRNIQLKSWSSHLDHARQWHVLGGTGSIGSLVSTWLALSFKGSQVFLYSRKGYHRSKNLLKYDCSLFMTDTTNQEPSFELNRPKPLSSWVFSQGVISDYKILSQSPLAMRRAISSKVDSFANIYHTSFLYPVSRTFIFSSISSAFPNKGQVNYSVANLALELSAREQVKKGAEITCIQWGPWTVGMTKNKPTLRHKLDAIGMGLINPANGLLALESILRLPMSVNRRGIIGLLSGRPLDVSPRQSYLSDSEAVISRSSNAVVDRTALKGFMKSTLKSILSVEVEEENLFMDSGLDSFGTNTKNLINCRL